MTPTHSFTLILDGPDVTAAAHLDALYEAGLDDALIGRRGAVQYADIDREAATFPDAVASAIGAIESAVPGLRVIRLEPDDLVTMVVVAARTGRTRESVRLLVEGKRGPGGFPPPIAWVDAKTRLWQWSDVAEWFAAWGADVSVDEAQFIAAVNGALELRRRARRLSRPEARRALAGLIREESDLLSA